MDGSSIEQAVSYPINNTPPNALSDPLYYPAPLVGVRAIDGLLTLGKGQRMWHFCRSEWARALFRDDGQKHRS